MSQHPLDVLHEEHRQLRGLLAILERQLFSTHDGGSPDFEVMAELLDYLADEPEHLHHRFEARLLEALAQRRPELTGLSAELGRARGRIATGGRKLQRLVSEVIDGLLVPRQRLARLGLRYVRSYQALMAREEAEAFPALERDLRPADWIELITACHWRCGLSSPPLDEPGYDALRRRIEHEAGGFWPAGTATDLRCPVCDDT
ncbi:hemerythrin domain-containing protein [Sediminicurvatus halobius]|uniref:Hemerythrin-like domain-containing protein n=1 Tax=Sediminicurvatus halobius TaxID=2182432 RepID=A0A2U2MVX4_9GAMM|nr:hemerythrin domain-containing protein [Spiribacter halobius]PWG60936.1 hypothetical protein DEM34_19030 [Spiribacter halobius]UEX76625.1 hemerythrin domain-containing protein [Spiribacter halobius]